ncbi:MAG: N-acetylglucosamine-6-phosphate deacetylase [Muribaculaceae bacterium]|nr:N-acetylglucosamine-6-phosphate deacetylase [Muribaculaceae bacterium]
MLTQFINAKILTPEGWIEKGSVLVEDNKIVEVTNSNYAVIGAELVDAKGMYLVPGGVEIHVHGGGGRDFMEGTEEAFKVAVDAHLKHGTTSIFPTLSSSTVPMIEAAAETCTKIMNEDPNTPILGLHLEGHYLNLAMAGGQLPENIKDPDPAEYEPIINKWPCIKRWDAAPELPGAVEFGKFITSKGVLASIAHTQAEYKDVKAGWDAGFTHATHFYNAMTGVHKCREFKYEGTIESVYLHDDMTVELVADGIHVPPAMLNMVYKIKGVERTCAITDALAVAASDSQTAFDPRVIIEDGVCKLSDRSALAGSIATMDRLIRTMVQQANIPLRDALRMISESPAKIMNVYDRKGSLEKGKDADMMILDEDLNLRGVWSMGKLVEGTYTL